MEKLKFLSVGFLVVALSGMAYAVEVINIDLNNYGDDTAYTGTAVYDDGINEWNVYYGDWGLPMGSPRSSSLTYQNDPCTPPGVYASQIWIGDPGINHDYLEGTALMDDGFVKSADATADPTINLIGGEGGYGGTYDIYVYGDANGIFDGIFTLTDDGTLNQTQSVTGTTSGFVLGENYVIFEDITIGEANDVVLTYTYELTGLQLVSTNEPFPIQGFTTDANDRILDAREYDVAFDTNARGDEELSLYGPDIGNYVHYLDAGEYMDYDITVDVENKGQYEISAGVVIYWGPSSLDLYVDDDLQGTIGLDTGEGTYGDGVGNPDVQETNKILVNLFEGSHTIRWATNDISEESGLGAIYCEVVDLRFNFFGELVVNDCDEVTGYGLNLPGDINLDCRVNFEDFVAMAANWTECNNPEEGACP